MHYYKRNIGDYAKKAGRLSMLQHGSYTLLIDACYDREQFPTLAEAIEWSWASTEQEIEAVKFVLSKFFMLDGDVYVQHRIQEELAEYHGKSATNKRIAEEREAKRKVSSTTGARTVHEAPPNHKPLTINQEPVTTNHEPGTGKVVLDKPTTSVKTVWEKPNATGTRLPADWKPNLADIDYCKTERPDLLPSRVASNFYDYWIAIPGAKGRKLDWSATWRGWVRKESAASAGRTAAGNQRLSTAEQNALNNAEAMKILEGKPQTSDFDEMRTIDV